MLTISADLWGTPLQYLSHLTRKPHPFNVLISHDYRVRKTRDEKAGRKSAARECGKRAVLLLAEILEAKMHLKLGYRWLAQYWYLAHLQKKLQPPLPSLLALPLEPQRDQLP